MSNQYEMYSQDLHLINYSKPCRMLVEVHIPRLAVSRVYVLCIPLTSENLGQLVLVEIICTNRRVTTKAIHFMFSERCVF